MDLIVTENLARNRAARREVGATIDQLEMQKSGAVCRVRVVDPSKQVDGKQSRVLVTGRTAVPNSFMLWAVPIFAFSEGVQNFTVNEGDGP